MSNQSELTARQAAQRLGVSLHFIYQLLWSGKLSGKKTGKVWLIPEREISARLSERVKQS